MSENEDIRHGRLWVRDAEHGGIRIATNTEAAAEIVRLRTELANAREVALSAAIAAVKAKRHSELPISDREWNEAIAACAKAIKALA